MTSTSGIDTAATCGRQSGLTTTTSQTSVTTSHDTARRRPDGDQSDVPSAFHRRAEAQLASSPEPHGGNRSAAARRLGCRPEQLLDASASLVPFGPPARLRRRLAALLRGPALLLVPLR